MPTTLAQLLSQIVGHIAVRLLLGSREVLADVRAGRFGFLSRAVNSAFSRIRCSHAIYINAGSDSTIALMSVYNDFMVAV